MGSDDVEFLGIDGDDLTPAGDDELAGRRTPRWVYGVIALVILAIVGAGLGWAALRPSRKPAPAASSSSTFAVLPAPPDQSATSPVALGTALDLGSAPVLALATVGTTFVALQSGRLSVVDLATGRALRSVSLGSGDVFDEGPSFRLVPDATAGRLWLITDGIAPEQVREYDVTTLHQLRRVTVSTQVVDATTLDGHLYLATSRGLLDLGPHATRASTTAFTSSIQAVAAEPTRHQLVMLDGSGRALSYRPGGAGRVLRSVDPNRVIKGSLAVVDGKVWIAGYGVAGPVLDQLDPATLQPVLSSPLVSSLDPGPELVAAGQHVLWIRSGGAGDELWCVGGTTGGVEQDWAALTGPVASTGGRAVSVLSGEGVALPLSGCQG